MPRQRVRCVAPRERSVDGTGAAASSGVRKSSAPCPFPSTLPRLPRRTPRRPARQKRAPPTRPRRDQRRAPRDHHRFQRRAPRARSCRCSRTTTRRTSSRRLRCLHAEQDAVAHPAQPLAHQRVEHAQPRVPTHTPAGSHSAHSEQPHLSRRRLAVPNARFRRANHQPRLAEPASRTSSLPHAPCTAATAPASVGSPSAVPVPCASRPPTSAESADARPRANSSSVR